MDKKIEAAIRETLVIGNPVSIKRCVDKLKLIFEQEQALRQANVSGSAIDVVKWIADCPINIDEATVPKAGIDAAPEQVVVNLSLSYKWWLKLKEVAEHCR